MLCWSGVHNERRIRTRLVRWAKNENAYRVTFSWQFFSNFWKPAEIFPGFATFAETSLLFRQSQVFFSPFRSLPCRRAVDLFRTLSHSLNWRFPANFSYWRACGILYILIFYDISLMERIRFHGDRKAFKASLCTRISLNYLCFKLLKDLNIGAYWREKCTKKNSLN